MGALRVAKPKHNEERRMNNRRNKAGVTSGQMGQCA